LRTRRDFWRFRLPPPVGELRGYSAILVASALFGASATIGTLLMSNLGVPPLAALVMVHGIASLVFIPWALRARPKRADTALFLLAGLNGAAVSPLLWFAGVAMTTATEAALLANLEALFTVLFAYVFLKERVPRRGYVGIAALLVGAVAVTTEFDFVTFGFKEHLLGNTMLILSAVGFGIDNNVSRVLVARYDRRGIPFFKLWIGLAVILPLALVLRVPFPFNAETAPLILLLAIGGVAGIMWFFYIAFQEIGAMRAGAIISTSALFGVAIAFAVFGDPPSAPQLGGGLLMVAGTFLMLEWTPRLRRNPGR